MNITTDNEINKATYARIIVTARVFSALKHYRLPYLKLC